AMLVKSTDNVLPIEGTSRLSGRHIGAILMDEGKITPSDAEQVLKRQRELGWRFGEAAIELNLITDTDLREALAKQYEFPYLVAGPVPPNPLELLSRPSYAALLAKAQQEYDVILIDTPPATEYADAQCVAFRAGDVMMVSRRDLTRVEDTERAVKEISDASARIV